MAPALRMCASASRSRWPVVTPGLSSPSTRARTSATIRPARRMRSISARDLRVTMSVGARGAIGRLVGDGFVQVLGNRFDRALAIDDSQEPGIVVVVDDIAQIGELQGQPRSDRLGFVIRTLDER